MSEDQRIAIGLLSMLAWGYFVIIGLSPVDEYVNTLKDIMLAVGIYHITLKNPKDPQ